MKIWFGYGSDHSAGLVMIGEFKTADDAERVYDLINKLIKSASSDLSNRVFDYGANNEQLSEETEASLRESGIFSLSPSEIADFAFWNPSIEKSGNILRFRSDDVEIGGFVKLLVTEGAKIQIYSNEGAADE